MTILVYSGLHEKPIRGTTITGVNCYVFGLHREDDEWIVTHIPSGYVFCVFQDQETAEKTMRKYWRGISKQERTRIRGLTFGEMQKKVLEILKRPKFVGDNGHYQSPLTRKPEP